MYKVSLLGQNFGAIKTSAGFINMLMVERAIGAGAFNAISPEEEEIRKKLYGTGSRTVNMFPMLYREPVDIGQPISIEADFINEEIDIPLIGPAGLPIGFSQVKDNILQGAETRKCKTPLLRIVGLRSLAHSRPKDAEGKEAHSFSFAQYVGHIKFNEDLFKMTARRQQRRATNGEKQADVRNVSATLVEMGDGVLQGRWSMPYASDNLTMACKKGRICAVIAELTCRQEQNLCYSYALNNMNILRRTIQSTEAGAVNNSVTQDQAKQVRLMAENILRQTTVQTAALPNV